MDSQLKIKDWFNGKKVLIAGGQGFIGSSLCKKLIYDNLPAFWGPFLYVIYRLVFRLGVLDGPGGVSFHILQGFWYRYIVNLKIEVQIKSRE